MKKDADKKNWLEWTVTVSSGILVAFTIGFLTYQMIYEEKTPPDIEITLGKVVKKDGGFAIPVSVYNKGTETAENVMVEVVIEDGKMEEKSSISFQYLPRKSTVKGWVTFSVPPKSEKMKSRIIGYNIP